MTREDVPQDVHDVLWTAYRDAGGNLDAGAVELAREVVRLRAKLQAARERVHGLPIDCYGDANAEGTDVLLARRDCVLAALGGDE